MFEEDLAVLEWNSSVLERNFTVWGGFDCFGEESDCFGVEFDCFREKFDCLGRI